MNASFNPASGNSCYRLFGESRDSLLRDFWLFNCVWSAFSDPDRADEAIGRKFGFSHRGSHCVACTGRGRSAT